MFSLGVTKWQFAPVSPGASPFEVPRRRRRRYFSSSRCFLQLFATGPRAAGLLFFATRMYSIRYTNKMSVMVRHLVYLASCLLQLFAISAAGDRSVPFVRLWFSR
jgi:hypothetical protein